MLNPTKTGFFCVIYSCCHLHKIVTSYSNVKETVINTYQHVLNYLQLILVTRWFNDAMVIKITKNWFSSKYEVIVSWKSQKLFANCFASLLLLTNRTKITFSKLSYLFRTKERENLPYLWIYLSKRMTYLGIQIPPIIQILCSTKKIFLLKRKSSFYFP